MKHELNRLSLAVHNQFCQCNDDEQYNEVVEFFESFGEQWAEEMGDALERLGYCVTKD